MTPSQRIDQLIEGITDWRGKTFAGVRKTILEADKEIIATASSPSPTPIKER
jgi:hypothetical protein